MPGSFDDTLPCLETAKMRTAPKAVRHDDAMVLENGEYKKLHSKLEKKRSSLVKSHEKVIKVHVYMHPGGSAFCLIGL